MSPAPPLRKAATCATVSEKEGRGGYPGDRQDLQMPNTELHDLVFSLLGFALLRSLFLARISSVPFRMGTFTLCMCLKLHGI